MLRLFLYGYGTFGLFVVNTAMRIEYEAAIIVADSATKTIGPDSYNECV